MTATSGTQSPTAVPAEAASGLAGAWSQIRARVAVLFRRIVFAWRRSIQTRVVGSTLLLSVVVLVLLGQLLVGRIRDGLLEAKTDVSVAEARTGLQAASRRLAESGSGSRPADPALLTDLTDEAERRGNSNQYDVVLFETGPGAAGQPVLTAVRASSGIDPTSVPADLIDEVSQRNQVFYRYTRLSYETSGVPNVAGIVVGSQISGSGPSYQLYYLFPLDQEQRTLGLVRGTVTTTGALLVLLLGAIAYMVTRQVVTPVRMAARIAERITAGQLDERMRVSGEDDLARLATSFNRMATNLQQQIRQLEDLSRVQRRFVSDVSHELRTPLTTVRMAADVLHEARPTFDPHVARSAELLQNQLDRFEALLTDLLEISRFDAGAAVLEAEPTDLREIAAKVIEYAEPLADRRGSTLRLVGPRQPCVAEVDQRRIERVLRNLVANAIEHGDGGEIVVKLATNHEAVAVAVRDYGVGLKPGEASLVFNRFWRADPARARTSGGTGLGLSIALEDAHLHGGWLQAWGQPGRGSQFRLTVPRVAGADIERSPIPLEPEDARRPRQAPASLVQLLSSGPGGRNVD
ncbi:MAG TPA: MtrAB system histidine kinase MtrB [Actinomycetes bacterium]|jgi:two-component system sensor histidine kinase MtrB|nr:MtrAB system histidine kinase MtrB [Actinomycetes bacterium]